MMRMAMTEDELEHEWFDGDCGERWMQIGPANFSIRWKGDLESLERIAMRRFGKHMRNVKSCRAARRESGDCVVDFYFGAEVL